MEVFEKIKKILDANKIKYSVKHHEAVYTSEQAAKVRVDNIRQGAKAIIMKTDNGFVLLVLSAEKRIDSKKVKALLGTKSASFADVDKVKEFGLQPGSVPPFGSVIGLKTYVDRSLLENKKISFNAGSLTDSIEMELNDYLKVESPIISDFS
jgi:Ala-tRNA(Pro) deacylase